jgi:hypothetical protein
MRYAERIHLVVFSFLLLLSVVRALPPDRRLKAIWMGVVGFNLTLASANLPDTLSPLARSVIRDWLPAPLMLLVYWQAGQFFVRIQPDFQRRLARLDETLVAPILLAVTRRSAGRWLLAYLELAYLFCYPMIPFSMAAVYLLRMGAEADRFWSVVLPATYFCYVMVPFAQMLPPRLIEEPWRAALPESPLRTLNLGILRHASIHANTFPSAHVAASISSALILTRLEPRVGLVFLWIAISISFGAVWGRYHYAADAILGAAVALAAFVIAT